jgi:hypothetical protein
MLWRVDGAGHYTLRWDVPPGTPAGEYRMRVTASRYELVSDTFTLSG